MWRSADSCIPSAVGPLCFASQILLQRAAVDADADRDALVLGDVDDLLDERLAPMFRDSAAARPRPARAR